MQEDIRIYKFLHIPVQSGSDVVLDDMKRKYTVEDFQFIVDEMRKRYGMRNCGRSLENFQ